MTGKKAAPAKPADESAEAQSSEAVADAGQAQAEARRTKGYIGSAPGENTNDTVAAVTKEA